MGTVPIAIGAGILREQATRSKQIWFSSIGNRPYLAAVRNSRHASSAMLPRGGLAA